MSQCDRCGSYAINHHCHGRDGSDGDLCDVCYWRKRAERQPLTDGQLFNMAADYYEGYGFKASEFARAIERAHWIGSEV